MTAFDRAWDLLKMPFFDVDGEEIKANRLYQGGIEGEEQTPYWTKDPSYALLYALFGAGVDTDEYMADHQLEEGNYPMREGKPLIRYKNNSPNKDIHFEQDDWGYYDPKMSVSPTGTLSNDELIEMINEYRNIVSQNPIQDNSYSMYRELENDTSAGGHSQNNILAHIDDALGLLRDDL